MAKKHAGHILLDHIDGDIKDDEDEVDEDGGNIDLENRISLSFEFHLRLSLGKCLPFDALQYEYMKSTKQQQQLYAAQTSVFPGPNNFRCTICWWFFALCLPACPTMWRGARWWAGGGRGGWCKADREVAAKGQ